MKDRQRGRATRKGERILFQVPDEKLSDHNCVASMDLWIGSGSREDSPRVDLRGDPTLVSISNDHDLRLIRDLCEPPGLRDNIRQGRVAV